MRYVRTVLDDVPAVGLGPCYAHEHLIIDPSFATVTDPDFLLDSVELAARELAEFRAAGGCALVDSMPCDCGRNVRKLAALSRLAGVHIVAPTGIHLAKYYDPGHWSHRYGVEALAELFVADIEEGIDANDYGGPRVERTPHRAGVIKVATGREWTPREERVFAAAAAAHRATGCPILTHTEGGALALEQAVRLRDLGVDLGHVVISHMDRFPDAGAHRAVLRTGARLEYDSAFRWKGEANPTLELVVGLAPEFPDQILLGMDAARRGYWRAYGGGPGMTFLLEVFRPRLIASGLDAAAVDRIFLENPARAFALRREG